MASSTTSTSSHTIDVQRFLENFPQLDTSKTPAPCPPQDPNVLAVTTEGTLQINDIDNDGLFDGVTELQVHSLGTTTSDPATVKKALSEICISDVKIGTPYASLHKFAALYEYAKPDGISSLPGTLQDRADGEISFVSMDPKDRLAQLESIASDFEAARNTEGVTVNDAKMEEESKRLYANLFEEASKVYQTSLGSVGQASSPEELRATETTLNQARADIEGFARKIGVEPNPIADAEEAYKQLADEAFAGFQENAAEDSKSAREFLAQYREYAAKSPFARQVSEKEIKKTWEDAAKANMRGESQAMDTPFPVRAYENLKGNDD